ncbi:MAG: hypothetical protein JXA20_18715 [Spirochaetes bacterium]|nr:hypothetical protein [Spirochaetota bacterium]
MVVSLKRIYRHDRDPSRTVILLSVQYGWGNVAYRETFQILCDTSRNRVSVSVRIKNPGIGHIVERISEILAHHLNDDMIPEPVTLVEHLAEDFEFEIDSDQLRKGLGK